MIPKSYQLLIHPLLNDTEKPFSFSGTVWITFLPTIDRLKTIELDSDGLAIDVEQIAVYRSHTLSLLDFPANGRIEKNKRSKRNDDYYYYDYTSKSSAENTTTDATSAATPPAYFTDIDDYEDQVRYSDLGNTLILEKLSETNETNSFEWGSTDDLMDEVTNRTTDHDKTVTNLTDTDQLQGVFINETSEMKVADVDVDLEKMKIFIKLDKELVHDNIYIVKINFAGKMTKTKGLSYAEYEERDGAKR